MHLLRKQTTIGLWSIKICMVSETVTSGQIVLKCEKKWNSNFGTICPEVERWKIWIKNT